MYRVRKSWNDSTTQLGAYEVLDNAIAICNQNPGYFVFDEEGNVVHGNEVNQSANTEIRTMSYKAKLKKRINSKHTAGEKVTVTINRQREWVLTDGTVVPNRNYLDLTKQLYDPDCRYPKADAEKWVNSQGFSSPTPYLFWANKWCQRVYIFKGKKGAWELIKVYKCGTGKISDGDGGDPGVYFSAKIWDKHKTYQGPRGMLYWVMHYSSKWGNAIHKGVVGKPSTHGCIALADKQVRWVYDNLPLNTRVILF